jgi:hypothetical protein
MATSPTQPWRDALEAYFDLALPTGLIDVDEDNTISQTVEAAKARLPSESPVRCAQRVLADRTHELAQLAIKHAVPELAAVQFERQLRQVEGSGEWVDPTGAEDVAAQIDLRAGVEQAKTKDLHKERLDHARRPFVEAMLKLLADGSARRREDFNKLANGQSASTCTRELRRARALKLVEQIGGKKTPYKITEIGKQILAERLAEVTK